MKYTIEGTVYYQRPEPDTADGWIVRAEGRHATDDNGTLAFPDLQVFWVGTVPPQSGDQIRVTVEWVNHPQVVGVQAVNEQDQANG